MDFKEKIDKILNSNTLGLRSVSALEEYLGCGRRAINDFYNENREPGRKTMNRILSIPNLNTDWWYTGEGDVFYAGVREPQVQYSANQELIEHLKVTNSHLFGLTDDLRDRIKDLEKKNSLLMAENERLTKELKECK